MFTTESEKRDYALKPMNCPGHILIFKQGIKSYRDLPLRYGEFGQCHRNEPTGGLHGIMRVRGFTQDDGHIFCTEEHILPECVVYTELLQKVYRDFGFTDILYKVATRPDKRIGSDEIWDKAEHALMESLRRSNCDFTVSPGDGAFYGPKIDFDVADSIGRKWQLGTIQLDYNAPERFDLTYIGPDNTEHRPVVIHRAIYGSFERFIGILIEHYAGNFPVWLAPEQARILPVAERHHAWAEEVAARMRAADLRIDIDRSHGKLGAMIRDAQLAKIPYALVVGDKEVEAGGVSPRLHGTGKDADLGLMKLDDFLGRIQQEAAIPY